MIKLTNAHPDLRGEPIWINPAHIVTVYDRAEKPGGSLQTKVYGVTGQEWTVEESPGQIIAMMIPDFGLLRE